MALPERIALCLKAPTSQEALRGLKHLFSNEQEFAFTESISEFCFALVICGHYENIKDLRDRTRMLGEALDVINACIPDHRKGIEGNLLGSALTSFGHAGTLLLTVAEEHKWKALLTQTLVLSVQEKLDKWAAAVASVKDALTCPNESVLEAGQQAFAAFATSPEDAVSNALPGYVMDKHDFPVQHTLVTWLSMLSKAWDTHLATLLKEDCDLEALERWCQNQSTLRLDALSKDLGRMASFLKRQNHDFLSVNKCVGISVWAAMVQKALQKGMDETLLNVHDAKRFSCQMQKALTPLDDDHDARKSAILAFKPSPVVTQQKMFLKDVMGDHGSSLIAPLTVAINKHFSLPVQSGFFKAKQPEQLQAIVDWASRFPIR